MKTRGLCLCTFLLLVFAVPAQNLRHGASLQITWNQSTMLGVSDYQDDIFHFPAFFSNFTSIKGATFQFNRTKNDRISMGCGIDLSLLNAWHHPASTFFETSAAQSFAVFWNLQLHTKPAYADFWNNNLVFVDCSPTLGVMHASTKNAVSSMVDANGTNPTILVLNTWDLYAGLKESVGYEHAINQYLGFNLALSTSQNRFLTTSITETWFYNWSVNIGVSMYFDFDKKYYMYW
jgi:hypothetical protein